MTCGSPRDSYKAAEHEEQLNVSKESDKERETAAKIKRAQGAVREHSAPAQCRPAGDEGRGQDNTEDKIQDISVRDGDPVEERSYSGTQTVQGHKGCNETGGETETAREPVVELTQRFKLHGVEPGRMKIRHDHRDHDGPQVVSKLHESERSNEKVRHVPDSKWSDG